MKRLLPLLCLLLVAAGTPELLVHINLDGSVKISGYERVDGTGEAWTHGSWTLQALDAEDTLLEETTFEPYYIGRSGTPSLLEEAYVSVYANPRTKKLVVIDNQGTVKDTLTVTGTCGDGYCAEIERDTCRQDCPLAQEYNQELDAINAAPLEPETNGWTPIIILACSVLLIIILVLVIIHVNRKKSNPLEIEFNSD